MVTFWRQRVTRKSGFFPAYERGDFLKNSGILQHKKIGPFWGMFHALSLGLTDWWDKSKKNEMFSQ